MPYVTDPSTGYLVWEEPAPAKPSPAPTGPIGQANSSGMRGMTPVDPQVKANDSLLRSLDPSSSNYRGPGWERGPDQGGAVTVRRSQDANKQLAQVEWENERSGTALTQPALPTDPMAGRNVAPAQPVSLTQRLNQVGPVGITGYNAGLTVNPVRATNPRQAPNQLSTFDQTAPQMPGGQPGGPTGAPTVDRTRIDQILSESGEIAGLLKGLGLNADRYSEAQAQLQQGLADSQAQALSIARSGNRRDRAANEQRAMMTQQGLAADATRGAAILRGQEEEANKRIKLDAYTRAGELGLNVGALDLDTQNLDMTAATNYLNQLFEDRRLGRQLDQQEAERVTNFVRDMALISKDYYALNQQERQSIRDDLTKRYGIDQQLAGIMNQLDAEPSFWEKAALGFVGGASQGGTAALATVLMSDEKSKEKTSDANAKTNFSDAEGELSDLLKNIGAKTYEYKDEKHGKGRFAGPMAQDLEKSAVGKSMVSQGDDGLKKVDGARAGLAALAAVSMVNEKLKRLEESL